MNSSAKLIIEQNRLSNSRTNHILHLVLSIMTGGIWIPVWILITISNSIERFKAVCRINKLTGEDNG